MEEAPPPACPACGTPAPGGVRYCERCGQDVRCPAGHAITVAGTRYCEVCGAPLGAVPPAPGLPPRNPPRRLYAAVAVGVAVVVAGAAGLFLLFRGDDSSPPASPSASIPSATRPAAVAPTQPPSTPAVAATQPPSTACLALNVTTGFNDPGDKVPVSLTLSPTASPACPPGRYTEGTPITLSTTAVSGQHAVWGSAPRDLVTPLRGETTSFTFPQLDPASLGVFITVIYFRD